MTIDGQGGARASRPRRTPPTGERADPPALLAKHRNPLRSTTRGRTDEQARQRTTVSELSSAA